MGGKGGGQVDCQTCSTVEDTVGERDDKLALLKKLVNGRWGPTLLMRITWFKCSRQNIYDKLVINLYVDYAL